MSRAEENSMGAVPIWPRAAATRSTVRVAPYPIGAALSTSLRSLLLEGALAPAVSSFFLALAGPLESPSATYCRALQFPLLLPLRSFPHPATSALGSALPPSVRAPIGTFAEHKILCSRVLAAPSHISSP